MPARHITALTGLRGVAASWVLAFHLLGQLRETALWTPWLERLLAPGYLGVDLFFVLSGFVISHVYATRVAYSPGWRSFMYRRFARMYPVHLFTTLLLLVAIAASQIIGRDFASGGNYGAADLARHLTLSHVWLPGGAESWNTPAWAIPAEWFANACFPLFAWRLLRQRSVPKLLLLVALGYLGLFLSIEFCAEGNFDSTYDWGILRCVFGFSIGAFLWRITSLASQTTLRRCAQVAKHWPFLIVAALLAQSPPAVLLPLLGLLVPLVATRTQRGWLSTAPAQYLGRISYSLYLTHHLLLVQLSARVPLSAARAPGEALLQLGFYALCVVSLAHLVHVGIEEPCRRLLIRRAQPTAEPSAP